MAKKPKSEADGTAGEGTAPAQPYVVLARKYRPRSFDDLIGQQAMVQTLENAFATDRIAQGYMLTGVRGVGKTTTARILARALNFSREGAPDRPTIALPTEPEAFGQHCQEILNSRHPDVLEMDAASNTGIDNIREIIESARYKPLVARYKVFIIDEVHMLSKGAFNALLKTLEEPPEHVKFIFATTEVRKVPVTVLSRCQRFDLRRVEVPVLMEHFARIVTAEGATAEPEALALIARAAEGSVRDGLSILDQAIAMGAGAVSFEAVRAMLGLADRGRIFDLLELVFAGQPGAALDALGGLYKDGADPVQVLADLAEAVHTTTRAKMVGAEKAGEALSGEEKRRAGELAAKLSIPLLSRAWQMLVKGLEEAQKAPDPLAAAEMVVIRVAHTADLPSPDELIRALGGEPQRRIGEPLQPQPRSEGGGERRTINQAGDVAMRATEPAPAPLRAAQPAAPPPAMSQDDYGAGPGPDAEIDVGMSDDLDLGEDFVGDPEEAEAQRAAALPDPRAFEDVVDLVGQRRDARLKVHLEEHTSLVKFDADAGTIDLFLLPGAPPEIANELREKLSRWTARRWMVALSKQAGEKPLGQVRAEREAAELEAIKAHPAVKAVMDTFPEARIASVKPVSIAPVEDDDGEESATG